MNSKLLKSYFILNGKSINGAYKALEISKSALYRKMNGITEFTRLEIIKLIEYLEIDISTAMKIFFENEVS
ncbi:hypothetical protein [Clostridium butyricum]|uniref:HTH cro/C1-type domain-containing protein n=1 Tax=Clostridium butyricum E4 str. BoNT E BL5262 TaxID=632245 RepID=C4IHJ0_CLOBU|nr:hypothetical protein [Clostridium butyricum]EEP54944.1 hypothetical protein CLP_2721 [Clostridium butyricum E4 str. BoNT E BL5262]NFL30585.1 XRE family transcriptional regulator [Clostridium butyricum]NFS19539.1 XRE family transcriptional regulator [Clostridium butyricum]